jgi:hypothetical protein
MNILQQTVSIPFWIFSALIVLLLIVGNYCGVVTTVEKVKQKKIKF